MQGSANFLIDFYWLQNVRFHGGGFGQEVERPQPFPAEHPDAVPMAHSPPQAPLGDRQSVDARARQR